MPNRDIVARMKDYFVRQIAHYEQMLSGYVALAEDLQGDRLDAVLALQATRADQSNVLEQEFRALAREWQAADDISETEHLDVGALAARAEGLAAQLVEIHSTATRLVDERLTEVRSELDKMRSNRAVLNRYRVGEGSTPGYIDRKA